MPRSVWSEEIASSEFGSLYMILVLAIAAILLLTVVKPMFRESQKISSSSPVTTGK